LIQRGDDFLVVNSPRLTIRSRIKLHLQGAAFMAYSAHCVSPKETTFGPHLTSGTPRVAAGRR
jgi:hypothetical protein